MTKRDELDLFLKLGVEFGIFSDSVWKFKDTFWNDDLVRSPEWKSFENHICRAYKQFVALQKRLDKRVKKGDVAWLMSLIG